MAGSSGSHLNDAERLPFPPMVLPSRAEPQGRGYRAVPSAALIFCLFVLTFLYILLLQNEKRELSHGLTPDVIPELGQKLHFDVQIFFFPIGWSSSSGWTLKRGSRALETKWTHWSSRGVPGSIASSTNGSPLSW